MFQVWTSTSRKRKNKWRWSMERCNRQRKGPARSPSLPVSFAHSGITILVWKILNSWQSLDPKHGGSTQSNWNWSSYLMIRELAVMEQHLQTRMESIRFVSYPKQNFNLWSTHLQTTNWERKQEQDAAGETLRQLETKFAFITVVSLKMGRTDQQKFRHGAGVCFSSSGGRCAFCSLRCVGGDCNCCGLPSKFVPVCSYLLIRRQSNLPMKRRLPCSPSLTSIWLDILDR